MKIIQCYTNCTQIKVCSIQHIKFQKKAVKGKTVNGYKTDDGNVALNIDSAKSLNSVVGHEITHILEGTELYSNLQEAAKQYAEAKGEYATRLQSLRELYTGVYKGKDFDTRLQEELTADIIGDYLFTDSDFVNNLSTEQPGLFKKIYNEIKYLCKVATAGSNEARALEKVKKTFEDAWKQNGTAQKNTTNEGGVKYSLSEAKIPTRNELESKAPMKVVDISTPQTQGSFAERRSKIRKNIDEVISKPYLNADTGAMIFLTKESYSHAFSNPGALLLNATEHLPELIENAVLVHKEDNTHGSDYANGVYTFFAAAKADTVYPVKLKVKEYSYLGQDLPRNIKKYFDNSPQGYAASYDTVVLEVQEMEKSPFASVKDMNQNDPFLDTNELSTIKVSDFLNFVKGKAEKYVPKQSLSAEGSQPTEHGDYNVHGEDIAYTEDIRPVRDDIPTVKKSTDVTSEFIGDPVREDISKATKKKSVNVAHGGDVEGTVRDDIPVKPQASSDNVTQNNTPSDEYVPLETNAPIYDIDDSITNDDTVLKSGRECNHKK